MIAMSSQERLRYLLNKGSRATPDLEMVLPIKVKWRVCSGRNVKAGNASICTAPAALDARSLGCPRAGIL